MTGAAQTQFIGHVMDDLTKAVVNGKMEWHDLVTSFGFTATTAHAAGLTIDEVSAAVSTLTQVSGHSGARRIQMELDNLMRSMLDITSIQKRAKAQGVAFDAQTFAADTFIQKLQYLQNITGAMKYNISDMTVTQLEQTDATKGQVALAKQMALTLDQNNAKFMKLTGGAAAFIPALILLENHGNAYKNILAQMAETATQAGQSTDRAFTIMRDSTGQKAKMLELTVQNIGIAFGLQLLPYINLALMGMRNFALQGLAFLQKHFDLFAAALKGIILVIAPTFIALGAILLVHLAPLAIAIGLIIVAGTALGLALKAHPEIIAAVGHAWTDFQGVLRTVGGVLLGLWKQLQQAFNDPRTQAGLQQIKIGIVQMLPLLKLVGVAAAIGFGIVVTAVRVLIAILPTVVAAVGNVVGAIGAFVSFVATHEVALDAFKAIIIAIGTAFAVDLVGDVLAAIPALVTSAAALWANAIAALALEWPVIALVAAIALLAFGIIELVEHWSQVKAFFGNIGHAIGNFLGLLGTLIGKGLGATGKAIGNFFSGLGTLVHNGIAGSVSAVEHAGEFLAQTVANGFKWLYQHNWYFEALVNLFRKVIPEALKGFGQFFDGLGTFAHQRIEQLGEMWATYRARVGQQFNQLGTDAHTALMKLITVVTTIFLLLRTPIGNFFSWLGTQAQKAWQGFLSSLNVLKAVGNWVQQHVIQPIEDLFTKLITSALTWGKQILQNIVNGMKAGLGNLGQMAGNVFSTIAQHLGFHSPPPAHPEAALWGPGVIQMLIDGMMSQQAMLNTTMQTIYEGMAAQLTGASPAFAAAATSAAGTVASGMMGSTSNTYNLHFPNATNQSHIENAIRSTLGRQQKDDQRKARRGGQYGGLRAGIDAIPVD